MHLPAVHSPHLSERRVLWDITTPCRRRACFMMLPWDVGVRVESTCTKGVSASNTGGGYSFVAITRGESDRQHKVTERSRRQRADSGDRQKQWSCLASGWPEHTHEAGTAHHSAERTAPDDDDGNVSFGVSLVRVGLEREPLRSALGGMAWAVYGDWPQEWGSGGDALLGGALPGGRIACVVWLPTQLSLLGHGSSGASGIAQVQAIGLVLMTDETNALLPFSFGSLAMAARLVPTLAMVSSAIVSGAGQAW
ncbi:hypothetical protein PSPO01_02924 [Paraphaeosphaeria sporulosa]